MIKTILALLIIFIAGCGDLDSYKPIAKTVSLEEYKKIINPPSTPPRWRLTSIICPYCQEGLKLDINTESESFYRIWCINCNEDFGEMVLGEKGKQFVY